MGPKRLLVCEREPQLTLLLDQHVDGWLVCHVPHAEGLFHALPANAVLLADDCDHLECAHRLRKAHMIGPIFSLGEDPSPPLVALPRPFRLTSLTSRLEISNGMDIDGIVIGAKRIDIAQRALVGNQEQTPERLTDKELAVLSVLLTRTPNPVSRDSLQTEIWGYHADANSHTVETHIWRLRQKLEANPGEPRHLLTEADGYRLILE